MPLIIRNKYIFNVIKKEPQLSFVTKLMRVTIVIMKSFKLNN